MGNYNNQKTVQKNFFFLDAETIFKNNLRPACYARPLKWRVVGTIILAGRCSRNQEQRSSIEFDFSETR